MKRIANLFFLGLCFLFLLTNVRSSAPDEPEKRQAQPKWEMVREGVQVLRLWKTSIGPRKPEIALLRLSDEEYRKFFESPESYINQIKPDGDGVLGPKGTHRIFHCHLAPIPAYAPGKSANSCLVTINHDWDTTSIAASLCGAEF